MRLEHRLGQVQDSLQNLESKLPTSDLLRSDAAHIAAAVLQGKLLPGRPPEIVAAASLYACCRQNQSPIGLNELARISGVDRTQIARSYRSVLLGLGITPPIVDDEGYIARLAEQTRKSSEAAHMAQLIVRESARRGIIGRSPMTMATAALYLACLSRGEYATQAELAAAAGVTEVSVRACIRSFRPLLEAGEPLEQEGGQGDCPMPGSSSYARALSESLSTIGMATPAE